MSSRNIMKSARAQRGNIRSNDSRVNEAVQKDIDSEHQIISKIERQHDEWIRSDEHKDWIANENQRINKSEEFKKGATHKYVQDYNKEKRKQGQHVYQASRKNAPSSSRKTVDPVIANITYFHQYFSSKCEQNTQMLDMYLADIRTYAKDEESRSIFWWCDTIFYPYPEMKGNLLRSTTPLSEGAKSRHTNHLVDVNGRTRNTLKSSICIPKFSCWNRIDAYYRDMFKMLSKQMRFMDLQAYYDLIAIVIIRQAIPAINTFKFVEFFKLQAKMKMLENLILAESFMHPPLHRRMVFSIFLMLPQVLNELTKQGHSKSGASFITGFAETDVHAFEVIVALYNAMVSCFHRLFAEDLGDKHDFELLSESVKTFWGDGGKRDGVDNPFFVYYDLTDVHQANLNKAVSILNAITRSHISAGSMSEYVKNSTWSKLSGFSESHKKKRRSVVCSSLFNYFEVNGDLKDQMFNLFPDWKHEKDRTFILDAEDVSIIEETLNVVRCNGLAAERIGDPGYYKEIQLKLFSELSKYRKTRMQIDFIENNWISDDESIEEETLTTHIVKVDDCCSVKVTRFENRVDEGDVEQSMKSVKMFAPLTYRCKACRKMADEGHKCEICECGLIKEEMHICKYRCPCGELMSVSHTCKKSAAARSLLADWHADDI